MIIPAFIVSVFGPFINLLTGLVNVVNNIFSGAMPVLQGISSLAVWYVKELYQGIVAVFNNLHAVVLIATLVGGASLYTVHKERADCAMEVQKQRDYDEWKHTEKARTSGINHPVTSPSAAARQGAKKRR